MSMCLWVCMYTIHTVLVICGNIHTSTRTQTTIQQQAIAVAAQTVDFFANVWVCLCAYAYQSYVFNDNWCKWESIYTHPFGVVSADPNQTEPKEDAIASAIEIQIPESNIYRKHILTQTSSTSLYGSLRFNIRYTQTYKYALLNRSSSFICRNFDETVKFQFHALLTHTHTHAHLCERGTTTSKSFHRSRREKKQQTKCWPAMYMVVCVAVACVHKIATFCPDNHNSHSPIHMNTGYILNTFAQTHTHKCIRFDRYFSLTVFLLLPDVNVPLTRPFECHK